MKKILFAALILSSQLVFAGADGDKVGNGGGGQVCGTNVELYDFYEGRHPDLYHFKLVPYNSSITTDEYINFAFERLGNKSPGIVPGLKEIIKTIFSAPYDQLVKPIKIPRIPDADIPFIDEDCEYEQIANWNERFDSLFLRKRLFELMNSMNQAGLLVHEAIYKAGRDLNHLTNSNRVRKLVAKIFSEETIISNDIKDVFGSNVLLASKTGNCNIKVEFSALPGKKCDLVDKSIELEIADKSFKPINNQSDVSCEMLHAERKIDLKYNAYEGSECSVSLNINGESYQMQEKPFTYYTTIEFKQF